MKIAFNPSDKPALTQVDDYKKDIIFDLAGHNIFARGVKFYGTDTNTWRPIVDNLTSDSKIWSLSANQGRILNLTKTPYNNTTTASETPSANNIVICPTNTSYYSSLGIPDGGGGLLIRGNTGTAFDLWLHDTSNVWYKRTSTGAWKKMDAGNADYASNADTVDGYHANGLFTNLSSSGGAILSVTIGGTTKSLGQFQREGSSQLWINGRLGALLRETTASGYHSVWSMKTSSGSWEFGEFNTSGYQNIPLLTYITDANYNNKNNSCTYQIKFPLASGTVALTSNIPTALKNPQSLTTFGVVYDGSAAKVVTPVNFVSQLTEGTSTITDGTMLITSYASNNGFADSNAVNTPYKRKAIHLWNYIKPKTDSLYATVGHNHDGRYVRYYAVTSLDCNSLANGFTAAKTTASNSANNNHSAFLYVSDVGTPFQLQFPDSSNFYIYKRYKSGSSWSGWSKLSAGYADSAAQLTTARKINGTAFNGTTDITTAYWGTTRNITIGNTTKEVNGSGNVSWSLSEIGLGAYLPLAGGTMTNTAYITWADSGSWGAGTGAKGAIGGLKWSGQSDYAWLYAEETTGDNLDLVMRFGDDNSNGLSIRNASNAQTTYISASGTIRTIHLDTQTAFFHPGNDSTLKLYSGKTEDGKSDGHIALQTSIDGTDGQTHVYPTQYGSRCVLALQPRGGSVYIGSLPNGGGSHKLNVNGSCYATSYSISSMSSLYQANDCSPKVGDKLGNLVIQTWYGVSFTSNCCGTYKGTTAVGIDAREGVIRAANYEGKWQGYVNNLSTNNTTDTWVPVLNGSTLYHRVIPTAYNSDPSTLNVNTARYLRTSKFGHGPDSNSWHKIMTFTTNWVGQVTFMYAPEECQRNYWFIANINVRSNNLLFYIVSCTGVYPTMKCIGDNNSWELWIKGNTQSYDPYGAMSLLSMSNASVSAYGYIIASQSSEPSSTYNAYPTNAFKTELDKKLDRVNLTTGSWNPRGYNLAADYHYNGGDVSFAESNGQMHVSIDGNFWQNEGRYRVLDTSDLSGIYSNVNLQQYISSTDTNWWPLVWGGSSHNNKNSSTGQLYKSYDVLSWQTSSQTLYTTKLQTTDITFPNSGISLRGIQGTVGDNDFWRIKGGATASNAGFLEIATADDGNEPIYVRQYSGVFSTVKRTLTLLDGNGYSYFPSYINIGGNENNNSSPDRVWGSNGSDTFLRSYRTSALNVANADTVDSLHAYQLAVSEHYGNFTRTGRLNRSGFYQSYESTAGGNAPWTSWMHLINCQHSNYNNNYALQIAASFYDNNTFRIRVTNGSVNNSWRDIITSSNWGSYIPNANNYYWANIKISTSSSTNTAPTFGSMTWGTWSDMWSDGTDKHPWYGYNHGSQTNAYHSVLSDYWGMTLKTANTLRLDFGTLLINGTSIYDINVASSTKASKLSPGRNLWGNFFDGTKDITGLITLNSGYHSGIRISNTYIDAIEQALIIHNNSGGIRFGNDAWDWNQWAGLKYVHSSKTIYLGLADGSVFTANSAQSGGTINLQPGISTLKVPNTINSSASEVHFGCSNSYSDPYSGLSVNFKLGGTVAAKDIYSNGGFHKNGSDNNYVLLGGGGHSKISDLSVSYANNSDKLDGIHASGLFTNLSNSGNNLSITVGGTNKTLTVGYASKAGAVAWSNVTDKPKLYWADVQVSTSSNTQTQPSVNTIYANNWFRSQGSTGWYSQNYGGGIYMSDTTWIRTWGGKAFYCDKQIYSSSSIRMSDIYLQNNNEINSRSDSIKLHLNYSTKSNVTLCVGGGAVTIGTSGDVGNNKFYVNGSEYINGASNVLNHVYADGFRHRQCNNNDYILLAGGGYRKFAGDSTHCVYLGVLTLSRGSGSVSGYMRACDGNSYYYTYTRQNVTSAYCKITFSGIRVVAAMAQVQHSGGGMSVWTGEHRGNGAWWLHCMVVSTTEVRVKGFCNSNTNNDSWWGGNPLGTDSGDADYINVILFGYIP